MRKKACLCKEGWTGPHCKQRNYHDDDVRGRIHLPVYMLQLPPSLAVVMSLLLVLLTSAVMMVVSQRRAEGTMGGVSQRDGGYRPVRG